MKAYRTLIRRLCFALVTARTLAFAAAPLVDLQILPKGGDRVAVMASGDADSGGLALHDPSTCAICALLHDTLSSPSDNEPVRADASVTRANSAAATAAVPAPPEHGFQSRAPPTSS